MATATSNSRESRRRRIVEGGANRLAFITGQISNLPLSPSQPQHGDASPLHDQILPDPTTASPCDEDKASASGLDKNSHIFGSNQDLHESKVRSPSPESTVETLIKPPASEPRDKTQPSPVVPTTQNPSVSPSGAANLSVSWAYLPKAFTWKQISAVVAASECTRLLCSVTIAFLVVLSYIGFPILGSSGVKSIISFRPVLLLLLTNITVIVCGLLLGHKGDSSTATRGENRGPTNGHDLAEQVGNALEIALVMQKVMDAVFTDFSIYAGIVICSLSFA